MKVNPTKFSWEAPTTNEDGTPITYELEYEFGVVEGQSIVPLMAIPSQLAADGKYEAPIAEVGFDVGEYSVAIRSFAKDDPARASQWSDPVSFIISEQIPNAPLAFGVI